MSETNRWLTDNWNLEIGDGVRDYLIMCFGHQVASCDRRDVADQIIANHHNKAEIERLKKGLQAVQGLIAESKGVAGLHLNGDYAPWGDLLEGGRYEKWLIDYSSALQGGEATQ